MATVNEFLTNFNGPNYHGRVHKLTRSDTPFLSMIQSAAPGGGEVALARTFEWQTFNLRSTGQNTVIDAAPTPDPENRDRSNVFNVLQTHLESVGVGYERMAQTGQFDGRNVDQGGNPITAEMAWQIDNMWKQINRDREYSLINGQYDLPSTSSDTAQTRGLIQAVSSNDVGALGQTQDTTATNADNDFTTSGHGFVTNDVVQFGGDSVPSGIDAGEPYFVLRIDDNDFQVSETRGGSPVSISDDGTNVTVTLRRPLGEHLLETAMQEAYDNDGLREDERRLLLVSSDGKRQLNHDLRGRNAEIRSRSVLGVNVQTVETAFGDLDVVLHYMVPSDTAVVVSLEQCRPWFRAIPNKGITFSEMTGKDGARDQAQLYTSIGLEYGNELAHAKITDLSTGPPAVA